jgi:DDE family transposase
MNFTAPAGAQSTRRAPSRTLEVQLVTTLQEVRARFARDQGLPFADSLSQASILDALNQHGVTFRDRIFSPVTTIWGFLSQVLSDDHSCRDAVARVLAHRAASGLEPCSPNPASYCNARSRLPTAVLRTLAKNTAQQLQDGIPQAWKWNGRNVFIADGSHVSMPDTPQNQKAYPQPVVQQEGIGFPLARLAVLLSLATGACHALAIAPYAGKGTGETTLLRQMYGSLQPGDVVVADALFDNYFIAWELRQRDIELVARVQAERVGSQTVQSRPDGDIIVWHRPNKPRGMSGEQYRSYPESLTMRQVSVDARDKNNRAEQFKVVTTILDASIEGGQISNLYERRWNGEVDIRSIKSTMKMDILRCKSPEMVEKEIWTHLLAYNLLRTVMAVAAAENKVEPRKISFKGAKQALSAFAPKLEAARPQQRVGLVEAMLKAVGYHRVGGRPGRWEPRARKRRPKPTKRLNQPRHVAKLEHNRVKWY